MGQEIADFFKRHDFRWFSGSVWGQGTVPWVFLTERGVVDLEQRKGIAPMDHRGKINLRALPRGDPGDAPDCICEYGPPITADALISQRA